MKDYVTYWQLWHHNWDNADFKIIQQISNLKNKNVIEIGCADGRLTFQLVSLCKSIIGVDIESRFIDIANKKKALSNESNIEFLECDAQRLPLSSNSADLVLFPWSLHEIPDPEQALSEAFRVLRDDGELLIVALKMGSDYEKIISNFVSDTINNDQNIDTSSRYEAPLKEVFGSFTNLATTEDGEFFSYFFDSREVAYDAFEFAFNYWYKKEINQSERAELQDLINQYWNGTKIELVFPAGIYFAKKRKKIKERSKHRELPLQIFRPLVAKRFS